MEFLRTVFAPTDGSYCRTRQPAKIKGSDEGVPPLTFPTSETVSLSPFPDLAAVPCPVGYAACFK